jgi:hypothetical protein
MFKPYCWSFSLLALQLLFQCFSICSRLLRSGFELGD